MDTQAKERIIRRIASGKLTGYILFNENKVKFTINSPSNDVLIDADEAYNDALEEFNSSGAFFTSSNYLNIVKDIGIWDLDKESKLNKLVAEHTRLQELLPSLKFKKKEEQAVSLTLEKIKRDIAKMQSERDQLIFGCADYIAQRARLRHIIASSTISAQPELLHNPNFLDRLIVYYYKESNLSTEIYREIARTEPWRIIWFTSKDNGMPLFNRSASDMTAEQCNLISWSRFYDFVYNSPNRPSDDIICDNVRIDAWYTAELKSLDSQHKKNSTPGSPVGGNEQYILADKEGAKEVYKLNDEDAKRRIEMRQKAILKGKEITEANLPDIAMDLRLEANRTKK